MSSIELEKGLSRKALVEDLRRRLARIEGLPDDGDCLSFGLAELDERLPQGGLAFGAVHEIVPVDEADTPAAFGFLSALLARVPGTAPLLIVLASKKLARFGQPHGHGLNALGLDPARLILVAAKDEKEALWTTEEAIRARGPLAVAAALDGRLDLKASQRLLHAARDAHLPLLLLRLNGESVPTAATRWRIAARPAPSDRFGLLSGWGWHAALERCRNGRPGEWMLEFDHATHRFRLAAAVAGASLAGGAAPSHAR